MKSNLLVFENTVNGVHISSFVRDIDYSMEKIYFYFKITNYTNDALWICICQKYFFKKRWLCYKPDVKNHDFYLRLAHDSAGEKGIIYESPSYSRYKKLESGKNYEFEIEVFFPIIFNFHHTKSILKLKNVKTIKFCFGYFDFDFEKINFQNDFTILINKISMDEIEINYLWEGNKEEKFIELYVDLEKNINISEFKFPKNIFNLIKRFLKR